MWNLHNKKIDLKIRAAVTRFARSRFLQPEAIKILNADIMSIIPYYTYANWMPEESKKPKKGEECPEKSVSLKSLQRMICRAAVKKLKLLPNTPRAVIKNK